MNKKYIHYFDTEQEFDAKYNGNDYYEPWVAYVDTTDEKLVTYNNYLLQNAEAWSKYQQLFCDEDLDDAKFIFASYPVKITETTSKSGWSQEPDYTDYTTFTALKSSTTNLVRKVATKYRPYMQPQEYTTNECGAQYYNRGEWQEVELGSGETIVPTIPLS